MVKWCDWAVGEGMVKEERVVKGEEDEERKMEGEKKEREKREERRGREGERERKDPTMHWHFSGSSTQQPHRRQGSCPDADGGPWSLPGAASFPLPCPCPCLGLHSTCPTALIISSQPREKATRTASPTLQPPIRHLPPPLPHNTD